MATTDATPLPRYFTAYRVTFPIWDNDGDLVTGAASLDSEISKDGGTFTDVTAEATEIATSSGMYYLDLTATEMQADTVALIIKTATTDAKTTPIVLYPTNESNGDIPVNIVQLAYDTTGADDLLAFTQGSALGVVPKVDVHQIKTNATAATNLSASARTILPGTVNTANNAPSTTFFAADDITETTADHFIGRVAIFYDSTDALYAQACRITDYSWDGVNSEALFTITTLTDTPSDNDVFVIV